MFVNTPTLRGLTPPALDETMKSTKPFYYQLIIAVGGVAIYLILFFATTFEPYVGLGENISRASFFSYLLLPDEYFGFWLGEGGVFSLVDRIPILASVILCLLAATSLGAIILADMFKHLTERLSTLEFQLCSVVFGLGMFSALISLLFFFCLDNQSFVVRFLTGFIAFCYCPFLLSRVLLLFRNDSPRSERTKPVPWSLLKKSVILGVLPIFGSLLILGGMIPSTDYDVLSYHLAGTMGFYESGRIAFVSNDVYENMPFGAEMFYLWGMSLTRNVFLGALIGKTIISVTTILTALGVYAFGRRFFSENAGLIGMLLYLTTPWIVYVSTAGLVDTVVGMYAFFAIYAVFLLRETAISERRIDDTFIFLAGFLAGCAAACKYPAALFVVFPVAFFVVFLTFKNGTGRLSRFVSLSIFFFAVLLACGGWYIKNEYYTGNPVYPLCYKIFGDSTGTWTPEVDARWTRVHSPHGFGLTRFVKDFLNVLLTSPWNAPLTVPFCLLLFFSKRSREQDRILYVLSGWLLFLFASWWLLTHRIDRFWLVAFPVLSILGGIGACWSDAKPWKRALTCFLVVGIVYGFLVSGAPAPGKVNNFLAPLNTIRHRTPWAVWFNAHRPEGKILLIGEAKAFLYDVPVLYNSCFNETPLKAIAESSDPAAELHRRGISYLLVDWSEIQRFRSPGNYGYSPAVQQEVFDRLVADGILERFTPTEELEKSSTVAYRVKNERERKR